MNNVFEFLGLPANHRTGTKITQRVKHIDEVSESKKSWPMYGQVKKDGVYALVVKTKYSTAIFSRTGKRYTNLTRLETEISNIKHGAGMDMAVYIAELCNDLCSLESLSGMTNPNRKKALSVGQEAIHTGTYLSYHDAIPLVSFISGHCKFSYRNRYTWLKNHLPRKFYLLDLVVLTNQTMSDEMFNDAVAEGEEGIVFKQCIDEMSDWLAGHKGYRQMKRVRGVDYDLLCIGAEEGKGKYKGLVANLIFKWKDGKTIKCMLGKGWTHDEAREMWENYELCKTALEDDDMEAFNEPPPYGCGDGCCIDKIFQVYALQESSKGKLRLPKCGELRHDKTEPDI